MRAMIQEFRPRDLKRIISTVATAPGVHPTVDDLAAMAQDTIDGVGGFTANREQAAAARQTIKDLKETPPCPSTKK